MANRQQIQFDFNRAKQKANELEAVANELRNLSRTNLQNTLNSLGGNWKGDNASAYIRKGAALQEKLNMTESSLRKSADTIRTIAKNIYDAEMEALRIAEERKISNSHSSGRGGSSGGGRGF